MRILVVDDESLARHRILSLLEESDLNAIIKEASSGKEAIQELKNFSPDLVFLDIQMTDMSGFDVLRALPDIQLPEIIFVTAFDHFAVQAFEVQALDFLLKPYKKDRFLAALHRARNRIINKKTDQVKINQLIQLLENSQKEYDVIKSPEYLKKIVLKTNKKYYFVPVEKIKYITSSAYYAEIFLNDKTKHLYRISMSDLISKLDPNLFIRVNRSAIIKLGEVQEVISEGFGDYSIKMNDGKSFSLTKNYRTAFLNATNIK